MTLFEMRYLIIPLPHLEIVWWPHYPYASPLPRHLMMDYWSWHMRPPRKDSDATESTDPKRGYKWRTRPWWQLRWSRRGWLWVYPFLPTWSTWSTLSPCCRSQYKLGFSIVMGVPPNGWFLNVFNRKSHLHPYFRKSPVSVPKHRSIWWPHCLAANHHGGTAC